MRTEMGTYHLRPFGQPCIEGFFGGRFAQALEDAGEGAIAAHAIDEIVVIPRQRFSPQAKAARGIALGPRPLRPRLLFARPARPRGRTRRARGAGGRAAVLRGRGDLAEFFLDRAWGEGFGRAGGGRGVGFASEALSINTVIARSKATKQSILSACGDMDCFASLAMTTLNAPYSITLARISASGTKHSHTSQRSGSDCGRRDCRRRCAAAWARRTTRASSPSRAAGSAPSARHRI